ncbi:MULTISPECIES: nucleoside triphosphate pyrophosphatase [unclassified Marinobacterium]|jgi:septum formation protein|uniref:Maf family protein n=1 Tax=unclassified Marinobacterium TaxID=2644139 RepID=UPI001568F940|nr:MULTISPECIES: Maf family nucleotide pyrophosphatase [unclassified Marinobacterium]NRP10557.1 Maf-like protein YceF [Marinobacterium sp. xm-g-48]NRP15812.1 Maf-like protein YceF [Marinobacterium sp. xm-a-152]NRP27622.1 Maf-like protein YceF [Marinobacterium sp. xm-d-420]NRP38794.1 Maf-like protein YceF [Marinobacterium sp. xm-a-121]NRP47840.1 Maf-like protein YceF [Marinobacterium sp. xm-d-543]
MKSHQLPIVLASSSKYRRELLSRILNEFEHASPDIDETPIAGESPEACAARLAQLKAKALAKEFPAHWIIGSDQLATLDQLILGKPLTKERAITQLSLCSGRRVSFLTSLALFNSQTEETREYLEEVVVTFRELSDAEITAYIDREQPLDCAGSFKCEGLGITLFESIESRDPNTLIGLPLIGLNHLLLEAGINPLLK